METIKIIAATLVYNDTGSLIKNQLPEVLVIDNGSNKKISMAYMRIKQNGYFSGGWNIAMKRIIEQEQPDYVWMLNDDVFGINPLMSEYILKMITQLKDDHLAIVSPAFNSPHKIFHPKLPTTGLRRVPWVDWTCPIVSTEWWNIIGDFDAMVFPGYGADLDWCKRGESYQAHYYVADSFFVYHIGSKTAKRENLLSVQNNVESMNNGLRDKYGVNSFEMLFAGWRP